MEVMQCIIILLSYVPRWKYMNQTRSSFVGDERLNVKYRFYCITSFVKLANMKRFIHD